MHDKNKDIPRPEFPNPQFERKNWRNLNGKWRFKFDYGNSGEDRDFVNDDEIFNRDSLEINVPFTYESELSGINIKDFCNCVWYKKSFYAEETQNNNNIVLLHFGAVDYHAKVWVNGRYAGFHRGGMSSFCFNISEYIIPGENKITVKVSDDVRGGKQPGGKQSVGYFSQTCHYTRTTGIWQTVWLEYIPFESYIKDFKIYTDIYNSSVSINASFAKAVDNTDLSVKILYENKIIAEKTIKAPGISANISLDIPKEDLRLWDIGKGELYSLELIYGGDKINSYFGMRDIKIDGNKVLINNKSVFQRLVLDQGFYPDGTWTAPTAEDLKNDILISLEAGFNGARLHQKIFEPLFHYYADTLGYITWGEHGNWGMDYSGESYMNFTCEWLEAVNRDFNHPSIVGWCPHNETHWGQRRDDLAYIYRLTKLTDPSRPVIDASGYVHVETDIFDAHDYDQNPESFKRRYDALLDSTNTSEIFQNDNRWEREKIMSLPYFVSEFGGTWWHEESAESENHTQSWGYGKAPEDIEKFYERFEGLVSALLDNPAIFALCYTQLTDVEQEQNGIVYYDRRKKFDMARLRRILTKKAAIEL
ncbi:MAG: beta-galactosidase [Oscillospiraceae bacterium]|nr:beta-galactosidase [Oscillospiraceae bacterium]